MRSRAPAALPSLAGLLAIYLVAPFVAGIAQLGMADWATADWPGLGSACAASLFTATMATLAVTLGGVPLGWLLARKSGGAAAVAGFVVQLPLALPPLASGILLLFLLGYASPIGELTNGALTDSLAGIILAQAFVSAPFLVIAARSAFAAVDPVLEDVAATLGHRPWSIFLRVDIPLVWRAVLAGMLLTWLRAFGEFGATVMVAYHPYSLPVYTYVAFGSQGLPAMLPVLVPTLLAAVAVMAAAAMFSAHRPPRGAPAADEPAPPRATLPAPVAPPPAPLSFAFRRMLDGFDLDVAWDTDSRRLAILGASGSGKSLTLRLIAGLDTEDAADAVREGVTRLSLAGEDLGALPADARRIAYVPQNYGLFPHFDLLRQVRFAVDCDTDLATAWIDRLGLRGLEHRRPAALSLGQQQRVALARAFSRRARLLLLDEPFSALDAPLRARLRREFAALQTEMDATTILVTHDPAEAFVLADEILILGAGRVLQAGPVETVFARPASETVAALLGADNIADGYVIGDRIALGDGIGIEVAGPPLVHDTKVRWAVRADAIRIEASGRYRATLLAVSPPVAGRRAAVVRLGEAQLRVADAGEAAEPGPCRVAISPAAVQVWARDLPHTQAGQHDPVTPPATAAPPEPAFYPPASDPVEGTPT